MLAVTELIGFGAGAGVAVPRINSTAQASMGSAAATFTTSLTVPAACNLLVVVVTFGDNTVQTLLAPTYNGVPMTIAVDSGSGDPGDTAYCAICYLSSPATGAAHDLFLDWSDSTNLSACDVTAYFIEGASASPNHATNSGSRTADTAAAWSINLSTTQAALIIGGRCMNSTAVTFTPGANYSQDTDVQSGGASHFSQSDAEAPAGTVAFDCTASALGASSDTDAIAAMAII